MYKTNEMIWLVAKQLRSTGVTSSYFTVSARAALVIPYEWELLEALVKSSIDISAGFPLSERVPPFSTLPTSNLEAFFFWLFKETFIFIYFFIIII